jgi:hypothetical protein
VVEDEDDEEVAAAPVPKKGPKVMTVKKVLAAPAKK